ncbi:hypothetical protein C808_02548 [Lachnospiraceae bacterium M18-1]|nr:hypothetical protein C808_02548 [Lachnospiraceae bacterium M18-1]
MKKISLNHDWLFAKGTITMMEMFMGSGEKIRNIDLPHDAMICQERTKTTANAHQTGFYPGGEYTYIKQWNVPENWKGNTVMLEFEGIADTCRIYLNGALVSVNHNPYNSIFVDAANYLKFGQTNEIKVEVCSVEQSSRWYSGAGLYRPVNVWVGGPVHIPARGVRIDTKEADDDTAVLEVMVPVCNRASASADLQMEIILRNANKAAVVKEYARMTAFGDSTQMCNMCLTIEHPVLWSDETPGLYTCEIMIREGENVIDSVSIPVGIRTLRLNAKQGLLVNGKPVKLRGTCIHHDNGLIGAATFPDAEYRRCLQMKEAGFNAIRSSHHPMSKAMLDACDRLGMFVMDELSDIWTRTKNQHDYANYFPDFWKRDVENMIEKDYNHPSVIIYSTGNEIPEAGTPRGAEWNRKIHREIKRLDSTRYTTSGINGLMAGADRMGEIICQASGMTPEQLAAMQEPQESAASERGGADAVNGMAEVMVGPLADAIATSPILEELIGEFAAANDIAGYNYLTALHEEDHRRHPNRVVLGTETFPADIVHLWDIVMRNPYVLGDFTWTGYDYLGEAGCGIFHYDGGENFSAHWPDRLAGIGDIDILGDRKPISYLRQAVFGIGNVPAIGVLRMDKTDKTAGKTPWMWKDNIASWTWHGYEGKTASVDVYANAEEVELLLNGKSFGRQQVSGTYLATYNVPYRPGKLEAISYVSGKEAGRYALVTAGKVERLNIEADRTELPADGESLAFVKIRLMDADKNFNRQQEATVTVKVEGNVVLQGFGSANPSCEGSYQNNTWNTYDGTVMAVIRSSKKPGQAKITVSAENCEDEILVMNIE